LPAALHFICGSTGAGKTTFAIRLATEIGGLRLSIDEWMAALFWMDTPQPLDPAWSQERVNRSQAQMWRVASEAAARGLPVVLDWGFGARKERARYAVLAGEAGLAVRLHFLDVPADERWRRVQCRNDAGGDTHQLPFAVTREMFDFVETLWEPPSAQEIAAFEDASVAS